MTQNIKTLGCQVGQKKKKVKIVDYRQKLREASFKEDRPGSVHCGRETKRRTKVSAMDLARKSALPSR